MTARHRMPTRLAAVVLRSGKVLLGRRVHDQRWELPGGVADLEAADATAELARLVRESTGQDAVVGPEMFDAELPGPDGPVQLVAFGCHLGGRRPLQISERYRQVAWLPVDELPAENLAPATQDALQAWLAHPENASD